MHEQQKLDEAEYFLARMRSGVNQPQNFRFDLSAFLSSARSVLQYALDEAKAVSGGRAWYDAHVSGNSVVKFFKEKRDLNIHVEPVKPSTKVEVQITETILVSTSVTLTLRDSEGNVVKDVSSNQPQTAEHPKSEPISVTYRYSFPDWSGQEDVIGLCDKYLSALKSIAKDGIAKGFLTT